MQYMHSSSSMFISGISAWNPVSVSDMEYMFNSASMFNSDISALGATEELARWGVAVRSWGTVKVRGCTEFAVSRLPGKLAQSSHSGRGSSLG
jgi:hypothetical protein